MLAGEPPFDWIGFVRGRARFAGGVRGFDELGRETFAVDIDGHEYFGEIDRRFLPNNNDFNLEVRSFGYPSHDYVGMPMAETCRRFTAVQVAIVQTLIVQLVEAGSLWTERPHLLTDYPQARFLGEVFFRDGWVVLEPAPSAE